MALTFIFPAVLAAASAAAVPIIIHLVLRTKPRRVVFPALRFVKKTHTAHLNKLRLKHLILLAMRMAILALIAVLIARWQIPQWRSTAAASAPVTAVILLDNSGSMTYRQAGRTALARAKELADQIVRDLPRGSKFIVMDSESQATPSSFIADSDLARRQISDVPAGYGHRGLAGPLAQAVGLLAQAKPSPKEVYVLTDMTQHAWADMPNLPKADDIDVTAVNCGQGQDANIAIGPLRLGAASVPLGAEVPLETVIGGASVGGDVDVLTELDGQPVDQRTMRLTAGQMTGLEIWLSPKREGLLLGRVVLRHDDPLEMDNTRYFALEVRPTSSVQVVTDRATDGTYFLIHSAIAPPPAAGSGHPWAQVATLSAEKLAAQSPADLSKARVIVLTNVAAIKEPQWARLEEFVRAGGRLWVVAGPGMSMDDYNSPAAGRLMPATLTRLEELPKAMSWEAASPAEPMLEPFIGGDNPPLSEVLCRGRFAAKPTSDARVILRYSDQSPAILTRPVGQGSVVFWNFLVTREYFDPAGLAQLGVLSQRTLRLLSGQAEGPADVAWGDSVQLAVPKGMAAPQVIARKPSSESDESLTADLARSIVSIKADVLGNWTVRFSEGPNRVETGFSVNAQSAESDLRPTDGQKLYALFPPAKMSIINDLSDLPRRRRMVQGPLDLSVPVLLALLALLAAESFLSNRFYRTTAPADGPTTGDGS